ncbi:related to alcohol dehydrogenase homolog Bli-4 [Ramularia collo-cygni]|uniref:Related to alcohol dehydrogenase homolog Bli-4 n=1 Tax=Ramularia collo-cygni TaxID=112498 RepID=A0A2D3UVE1_9PEZI|nr:related to alcohol dehydrogenase homolog Bli-4 [Ramularia collo-cygni]CZT16990.1 related to alcohol dehydrogenase homolog Bli-4 [Ramularia collo-cygni]
MFEWLFGKSFDPVKDIPSLEGKVILITGGNAGLGKETVLQLAKHKPKEIFLAARTASKAEAAIDEIQKIVPYSNISFIQLDLTSLQSVKEAAFEFKRRSDRLDILINNAGIMAVPWSKTQEGYEIQFATNHLGHALLTKLLLPTLLKTAEEPNSDVRVINVSSEGHMMAPGIIYDQEKLETYNTWRRYGQSKLANILHARELQRRYPQITATSLHPGVIITDLYASQMKSNPILRVALPLAKSLLTDVPGGAKNTLWAATSNKEVVRTSWYWKPVGSRSGGSFWHAQKADLAKELWEWTEEQLKAVE